MLLPYTMTKLHSDEPVALEILGKIYAVLECDYGDIMTCIPDQIKTDTFYKESEGTT